jgi:two-component system LytT family response regulator
MKAIIIDDETHNLQALHRDLSHLFPALHVAATCSSAGEGIKAIQRFQPNLVFLDVEMPSMSGLEMLQQFQTIDFDLIFTTAHRKYALEAFERCAIDFLLKPIEPQRLKIAVEKVIAKQQSHHELQQQIQQLLTQLRGKIVPQKIALPSTGKIDYIHVADIRYCEADGSITKYHCQSGKVYYVTRNLGSVEQELLPYAYFFRIHHKYLINLRCIEAYSFADNTLLLEGNIQLPVAQSRVKDFLSWTRK